MLLRLYGLFQNAALPGLDSSSHYFALSKMATEYLPAGHITGFLHEWLGGMPLFQFYAPLYFIIVSSIWWATFKIFPLALLFRASIFLIIFSVPVSFWYFLKAYFGRRTALLGIPLSLIFIFYPKIYSWFGIGAGAAIWAGLITGTLGISLVLFWLSLLENLRKRQDSSGFFILTAICVAALALTHTISFIVGSFCFFIYLLYYFRDRKIVLRGLTSYILGIALSAFWLIPFIVSLDLTSGGILGVWGLAIRPFYLLYPLKIPFLAPGALTLFLLTVSGLYILARDKNFFVPILLGSTSLFFIAGSRISLLLPDFTFHYQRLLPFIFIFILSISACALNWLWNSWGKGIPRQFLGECGRRKIYFIILLAALAGVFFYTFDIKSEILPDDTSIRQPLAWSLDEFEYAEEANIILEKLNNLKDMRRLFVQLPSVEGLGYLGSLHYFTSQVALINKQNVITGLYAQSAPLTPFIMPTIHALTSGQVQIFGDTRLKLVRPFYDQAFSVHLNRLKKFGVNYIVSYTPAFGARLDKSGQAALIDATQHFKIFKIHDSRPLAYQAPYKPALYLNLDGGVGFKDLVLAVFAGEDTYNFPVVSGHNKLKNLDEELLENISIIIVGGSKLDAHDLNLLAKLDRPLIVLNPSNIAEKAALTDSNIIVSDNFETIPKLRISIYGKWPAGWVGLYEALAAFSEEINIDEPAPVAVEEFTSSTIKINGSGPIIINAGYSPYWQNIECKECPVFKVSPLQMMVFGKGETTLEHKADGVKNFAAAVSLFAAAVLIIFMIYTRLFGFL